MCTRYFLQVSGKVRLSIYGSLRHTSNAVSHFKTEMFFILMRCFVILAVRDGRDMSAPVIGTLCNRNMWVELVSTGPDLLVIFTASSHFPGRGFFGNFSFVEILPPPPISASIDQNMYPAYREYFVAFTIFGGMPLYEAS